MNILKKIINYKKKKIIFDKKKNILFFNQNKKSLFKSQIVNNIKNNKISIIAEIKKASPSKGILTKNFNAIDIAKQYVEGDVVTVDLDIARLFAGDVILAGVRIDQFLEGGLDLGFAEGHGVGPVLGGF